MTLLIGSIEVNAGRGAALLPLALAATLAACGGGGEVERPQAATAIATHTWRTALAVRPVEGSSQTGVAQSSLRDTSSAAQATKATTLRTSRTVSNDGLAAERLFRWAEDRFPTLFERNQPVQTLTLEGRTYVLRYYPSSGNYLAVSDGMAYALGPLTGQQIRNFGPAGSIACTVEGVNCPSAGSGGSGGNLVPIAASPRNQCSEDAPDTLVAGTTAQATYIYSGAASGRVAITAVIDGEVLFNGRVALKQTGTSSGTLVATNGTSVPATGRFSLYQMTMPDGTTMTLGEDREMFVAGQQTCTRAGCTGDTSVVNQITQTVYPEGQPDTEFRLKLGQTLTKVTVKQVTQLSPTVLPPVTSTEVTRYTFEALETISVLGRSYDTCRYRISSGNDQQLKWLQVGTGTTVQLQTVGSVVLKSQLEPQ